MLGKLTLVDRDCVYPDRFPYARPDQLDPPAERHALSSTGPDGRPLRIEAWLLPPERPWRGIVLHAHGNAQNLTAHVSLLQFVAKAGYALFTLDYRGFGHSQGEPSLSGALEDVVAAGRYLYRRFPDVPLALFGQSMGAVMAGLAAPTVRPALLVLEAGFVSYPHLYRRRYPDARLELSLTDRVDEALEKVRCPVGLIHGTADDVVPFAYQEHFDRVLEGRPHWRLDLPDEGHLTVMHSGTNGELYRQTVLEWLGEALGS